MKYRKIICPALPHVDKMVLSKDQNVLLELFEAVRIGIISPQLAARTIGKVHHARWLVACLGFICRIPIQQKSSKLW